MRPERVVICSDSTAALFSLNSKKTSRDDLLIEIYTIMLRIQRTGGDVQFVWVPAHVGVVGNEKADEIAKTALKLKDDEIMKVPFGKGEAKSLIRKAVSDEWQNKWDTDNKGRHYYSIQKSIKVKGFKGKYRRDEVIFSRLRLGHTGLKSTLYLMTKCVSDKCEVCNVPENVEHVIMKCSKFDFERNILRDKICELGRGWNLEGILGISEETWECYEALFNFLKSTGLDHKI